MISQILCVLFSVVVLFVLGDLKMTNCPNGTEGAPPHGNNIVVENYTLHGCDKQPCTLVRGRTYFIEARLRFNYSANSILLTMITISTKAKVPPVIQLQDANACLLVQNDTCDDIGPGKRLTISFPWIVKPIGATGSEVVRCIIKDDSKFPQACAEFKVNVLANPKNMSIPCRSRDVSPS